MAGREYRGVVVSKMNNGITVECSAAPEHLRIMHPNVLFSPTPRPPIEVGDEGLCFYSIEETRALWWFKADEKEAQR